MNEPDYYAVLGVPCDASAEDIKQAFRRLSAHWHPDQNKRADAAERFDELNKAKEVLLDPKRRAEYDRDLEHAETGGSFGDDESAAHDDEETEVIIEPRTIDFGTLEAGGLGVMADVTLTWTGPEPGLMVPPRGDWWTRAEIKRPGVEALYVITLLAEAPAGMPTGNHRSHFTVVVNGVPQPVELVMKVRGTRSASSPVDRSTYAPGPTTAPATVIAAFVSRWSWVSGRMGWFFASLAALALSFHMPTFLQVLLLLSIPFELYRTFRPRRLSDLASFDRLWVQAALAAALLAVSIVVFSYKGQVSSPAASSGNTAQALGGRSSTTQASSASEAATTPVPRASEAATTPAPSASVTLPPTTTPRAAGIALPVTAWTPVGGASITPRDNGVFEVTYGPTYWGGVIAHANLGCNYRFSGQGRVLTGGGYGFSVYARIDSTGAPYGQGLQYDIGAGGYKDVQLPNGSESGAVRSSATDNNWHTITVQVLNGIYTSLVDGQVIFTGDMPTVSPPGFSSDCGTPRTQNLKTLAYPSCRNSPDNRTTSG